MSMMKYEGANFLRQRLILSTLSGRPLKISAIREDDETPGLRDYEANLLRLLDKITDGAAFNINETGTVLRYRPGQIIGGVNMSHDCAPTRGLSYYLEVVAVLGLFAKQAIRITLRGVTNHGTDPSIDTFRTATLPLLRHAGATDGLSLDVRKRGVGAAAGGEVCFSCPTVKKIRPLDLRVDGAVKRVRGVAYTCKVTPQFAARMVDASRAVLNKFLPDVWIYTDHAKGDKVANDTGYGISLVAETLKGHLRSADFAADLSTVSDEDSAGALDNPEAVGTAVAIRLLQEIEGGGVADSAHQWILVTLAALAEEDATSRLKLGKLTPYTVQHLRHVRDFLGVEFSLEQTDAGVSMTTVGCGLQNAARKTW